MRIGTAAVIGIGNAILKAKASRLQLRDGGNRNNSVTAYVRPN